MRSRQMKKILCLFALLVSILPGQVWRVSPTYSEMVETADLVAIVRLVGSQDVESPNHFADLPAGWRSRVQPIDIELSVLAVLKGEEKNTAIRMYHYRVLPGRESIGDGLLHFDPGHLETFLVFLRRLGKDRYVPVTEQLLAFQSVLKLRIGEGPR